MQEPETFFRLSPAEAGKLQCFAVKRGEIKERHDPHFHLPVFAENLRQITSIPHKPFEAIFDQSTEIWDQASEGVTAEFPYIEISNVGLGTNEYKIDLTPVSDAPSRARMVVRAGNIILSTTRPHRGAIAVIRPEDDMAIASTGFAVLRKKPEFTEEADTLFLFYALTSQMVLKQLLQRSSGGNYPAITGPELDKILIPLLLLDVQKKMVAEMEAARQSYRRKLDEADALLSGLDSFLLESVGITISNEQSRSCFAVKLSQIDGPINPERYKALKLEKNINGTVMDSVATIIEEKICPVTKAPNEEWDWIRIDDLENRPLDVEAIRTEIGSQIEGSFFAVQENDILLARLGPTILNQKIVLCPKTKRQTVASSEFLILRCKEGWNPVTVQWVLRTLIYRDLIYSKGRGGTPSRYRVNREDLEKLPFPKIESKKQDCLAKEINKRLNQIRCLREEAAKKWDAAKAQFEAKLLGAEVYNE